MSVSVASFTLLARTGSYAYVLSSCNPDEPVSFQAGDQPYDPARTQVSGLLGGTAPGSLSIATFPAKPVPSTWDRNPIKLVIYSSRETFGVPLAVFYGYYTRPNAEGLGFYFNKGQSQCDPYTGSSPARPFVDNSVPSIALL
jgi:hypothetical protein